MSQWLRCDGCARHISGEPLVTVLRRGGVRLDFCSLERCGEVAWAKLQELRRRDVPGDLSHRLTGLVTRH